MVSCSNVPVKECIVHITSNQKTKILKSDNIPQRFPETDYRLSGQWMQNGGCRCNVQSP